MQVFTLKELLLPFILVLKKFNYDLQMNQTVLSLIV